MRESSMLILIFLSVLLLMAVVSLIGCATAPVVFVPKECTGTKIIPCRTMYGNKMRFNNKEKCETFLTSRGHNVDFQHVRCERP